MKSAHSNQTKPRPSIMRLSSCIALTFLIGGIAKPVYGEDVKASEAGVVDPWSLSIEDLWNAEIGVSSSVSSKSSEKLINAPSSVTVYTQAEIRNMGISSVEDLLNFVPGYQVGRTEETGVKINTVMVRGRRTEPASPEVLFLIDGQRLNSSWDGGALANNNYMAVENIEQIEIIRGPGSSLYGSNALMGVVNIITQKTPNTEAYYGRGNMDSNETYFTTTYQSEAHENLTISFFGRTYSDAGSAAEMPDIFATPTDNPSGKVTTKDPIDKQDINLNLTHNKLKVHLRHSETKQRDFAQFGRVYDGMQRVDLKSSSIRFEMKALEAKQHELDITADYLQEVQNFVGLVFPVGVAESIGFSADADTFWGGADFDTSQTSISANAKFSLAENHTILYGAEYRNENIKTVAIQNNFDATDIFNLNLPITTDRKLINWSGVGETGKRDIWGLYSQYKGQIDNLTYYVGARYDKYSDSGENLSPRGALIYRVAERSTVKLMYGEAFRAPSVRLQSNKDLSFVGDPDIKPEIAKTLELAWFQQFNRIQYGLTFYQTKIENGFKQSLARVDQVSFDPAGFNTQTVINSDSDIEINGVEFEVSANPLQGLTVKANASLFSKIVDEPKFASDDQFAIIANYQINEWNLNLSAYHYGDMQNQAAPNNAIDAYTLVNSSVRYSVDDSLSLSLNIQNLADKVYYTNTFEDSFAEGIQGRSRSIALGLEYRIK